MAPFSCLPPQTSLIPAQAGIQDGNVSLGYLALSPRFRGDERMDEARVVGAALNGYINAMVSKAQRIILADHARLPWRFFGRLAVCAQAAL